MSNILNDEFKKFTSLLVPTSVTITELEPHYYNPYDKDSGFVETAHYKPIEQAAYEVYVFLKDFWSSLDLEASLMDFIKMCIASNAFLNWYKYQMTELTENELKFDVTSVVHNLNELSQIYRLLYGDSLGKYEYSVPEGILLIIEILTKKYLYLKEGNSKQSNRLVEELLIIQELRDTMVIFSSHQQTLTLDDESIDLLKIVSDIIDSYFFEDKDIEVASIEELIISLLAVQKKYKNVFINDLIDKLRFLDSIDDKGKYFIEKYIRPKFYSNSSALKIKRIQEILNYDRILVNVSIVEEYFKLTLSNDSSAYEFFLEFTNLYSTSDSDHFNFSSKVLLLFLDSTNLINENLKKSFKSILLILNTNQSFSKKIEILKLYLESSTFLEHSNAENREVILKFIIYYTAKYIDRVDYNCRTFKKELSNQIQGFISAILKYFEDIYNNQTYLEVISILIEYFSLLQSNHSLLEYLQSVIDTLPADELYKLKLSRLISSKCKMIPTVFNYLSLDADSLIMDDDDDLDIES